MTITLAKHYKYHIFVFSMLSLWLFFILPIDFINNILAIICVIGVLSHIKKIVFSFKQWYHVGIFFVINAYVTFAIFGYDLFLANTYFSSRLFSLFVYMLSFIWTSYLLQSFMDVLKSLIRIKNSLYAPYIEGYWKKWFILFVIMCALFSLWQIAYNPIVISRDSWDYMDGWLNNSYNTFRSPIYAFFIKVICTLAPTKPEVMWVAIAQNTLFSSLLATILMYLQKKRIRFRFLILAAIVLPLIPSFGLHTIVIWCDLACGMSLLWFTYVLVRIIDEILINATASKKQQLSLCIQLCISMVLTYFIRSNSFLVYLVMAPVLILLFGVKKKWTLFFAVIVSMVLVLLIQFPGYDALNVTTGVNSKVMYWAGIHDIQSVYYSSANLSEKTVNSLKNCVKKLDDPELKNSFLPDWVLYQNYDYETSELKMDEFLLMYIDCFTRNPLATIRSMLYRVRAYWVIDTKDVINCVNYKSIYSSADGVFSSQALEIGVNRQANFLTDFMDDYIKIMELQIPAMFVWRYGIWVALMMVSIMTLVFKKRYVLLIAYLPVFIYLFTLYLTSGWTDYRYGLPVFFIGMFFSVASLLLSYSNDTEASICKK